MRTAYAIVCAPSPSRQQAVVRVRDGAQAVRLRNAARDLDQRARLEPGDRAPPIEHERHLACPVADSTTHRGLLAIAESLRDSTRPLTVTTRRALTSPIPLPEEGTREACVTGFLGCEWVWSPDGVVALLDVPARARLAAAFEASKGTIVAAAPGTRDTARAIRSAVRSCRNRVASVPNARRGRSTVTCARGSHARVCG